MSDDPPASGQPTSASAPPASASPASAPPASAPPASAPAPTATGASPASLATQDLKGQKIRFDNANIKSTYCNVCNATSTREEVVINFGVNKTWDLGTPELEVQLEHRIILSPFAAKRLQDMLVRLIGEHEQRYGRLN